MCWSQPPPCSIGLSAAIETCGLAGLRVTDPWSDSVSCWVFGSCVLVTSECSLNGRMTTAFLQCCGCPDCPFTRGSNAYVRCAWGFTFLYSHCPSTHHCDVRCRDSWQDRVCEARLRQVDGAGKQRRSCCFIRCSRGNVFQVGCTSDTVKPLCGLCGVRGSSP